jgi:hypothetical protein
MSNIKIDNLNQRLLSVTSMISALSYGFSPSASGPQNVIALQAAINDSPTHINRILSS